MSVWQSTCMNMCVKAHFRQHAASVCVQTCKVNRFKNFFTYKYCIITRVLYKHTPKTGMSPVLWCISQRSQTPRTSQSCFEPAASWDQKLGSMPYPFLLIRRSCLYQRRALFFLTAAANFL